MTRSGRTATTVALMCVIAVVGFVLLQEHVRALEAEGAAQFLRLLGAHGIRRDDATRLLVIPAHHPAFHVLITPSCSSLASLIAFGCLFPFAPHTALATRARAVGTAASIVFSGNILRIAASVAVGLVAGRASLVLFHDWVGSTFTFVYTVGGYMLLLAVLLPRRARADA